MTNLEMSQRKLESAEDLYFDNLKSILSSYLETGHISDEDKERSLRIGEEYSRANDDFMRELESELERLSQQKDN